MLGKIEKVLESIRPILNAHGGDISLVEFDRKSGIAYVRFEGACTHCQISDLTLRNVVEQEIMRQVPGVRSVLATAR